LKCNVPLEPELHSLENGRDFLNHRFIKLFLQLRGILVSLRRMVPNSIPKLQNNRVAETQTRRKKNDSENDSGPKKTNAGRGNVPRLISNDLN
jgi:hypothetical protein